MTTLHAPLAVALLLLASGCGGDSDTTATSPAPKAPVEQAPRDDCLDVPQELLDAIASGAEDSVGPLALAGGKAVKSPGHEEVYLIAARMTASGVDGDVGVWASNNLTPGGGLILAVDGFAQQFTVWPDADETKAEIGKADPAVGDARDCL